MERTASDRRLLTAVRQPVLAALGAIAATAVVATIDPNEPGHYPTCPFLGLTGEFCPGCGSLRAVHALTRGEVGTAVGLNVLTVLAIVPVVVMWGLWLRRSWSGAPRRWAAPAPAIWALLGVVVVFWAVRNLPFAAALAP
jgi:hypothetical protein